eukprot:COSAG03_NODE_25041_length_268_cov_0.609467_1_plen_59_part_10
MHRGAAASPVGGALFSTSVAAYRTAAGGQAHWTEQCRGRRKENRSPLDWQSIRLAEGRA